MLRFDVESNWGCLPTDFSSAYHGDQARLPCDNLTRFAVRVSKSRQLWGGSKRHQKMDGQAGSFTVRKIEHEAVHIIQDI